MKILPVYTRSQQYPALQSFVEKNKVLFNTAAWVKNYPEENLVQCAIFNNNNDVIGCFVYYTFRKALINFIIYPPFTPNIDLFYINPSVSVVGKNTFNKEVSEALAVYFDGLKGDYKNLNLPYNIIDTQPFIWKGYNSRNRYSYIIDLAKSKDELWDNLSSEKRKSLNKAVKDKLGIEEAKDYELVYKLIIKSLSRNNIEKNTQVIRNILFNYANSNNSIIFIASNNGVPIGATFCVLYNDKAIYLFGGFDAENKHHGAGVSCMWQSILKAKEMGARYFDFEGSMHENIERYYREFGGELVPYFCVEKIKPGVKALLKLKGHKTL